MANKYGSYNMEVIKDHYDHEDLDRLYLTAITAAQYLAENAGKLKRKSGTLYAYFMRLSYDLKDLADAAHDADIIDEFPELCRR